MHCCSEWVRDQLVLSSQSQLCCKRDANVSRLGRLLMQTEAWLQLRFAFLVRKYDSLARA